MSLLLYNIFLLLYRAGAWTVSRFSDKARKWVAGRVNWAENLQTGLAETAGKPLIWMHCASLGEFEQGRPVLESISQKYPGYRVLLTFFSPSGYEIRKNYPGADYICYLPMDGLANARKFIEIAQPALVLWVRYEFWYYFLRELKTRKIPVFLVSGLFRDTQPFFKWYGKLYREILSSFEALFLQNHQSVVLLEGIGIRSARFTGDTRYDRVSATARDAGKIPAIEKFAAGVPLLIAGSTWPEDEEELDHFANSRTNIRVILAPHEISEAHLKETEALFRDTIRYSAWVAAGNMDIPNNKRVLLIDNIGMLSTVYQYASVAYVGGGFGDDGLHNILEAAVFGVPVVFGPEYDRFPEAVGMIESGAAFTVSNALELEQCIDELITHPELLKKAGEAAAAFIEKNTGATTAILNYMEAKRLLTN